MGLVAVSAASARTTVSAKTCPPGYVLANLSWGQKCLAVGEICKLGDAANAEYHMYGFDCLPTSRLTTYSGATAPTTTAPVVTAPTTTTPTVASPAKLRPFLTVLKPVSRTTPAPRTAAKALALVRANPNTNQAAQPFQRELGWVAQWRGDRWWLVGLFSSTYGTRFVVDATVEGTSVLDYISPGRPSLTWVRTTARRWHMATLYTRLTSAAAIKIAEQDVIESNQYTVLGAASKLAEDTGQRVGWYFAFYVQDVTTGARSVVAVTGYGGTSVEEGTYANGYGFGAQPQLQTSVPLNLSDWVHAVSASRHWN
jgi:hypothetical protein